MVVGTFCFKILLRNIAKFWGMLAVLLATGYVAGDFLEVILS